MRRRDTGFRYYSLSVGFFACFLSVPPKRVSLQACRVGYFFFLEGFTTTKVWKYPNVKVPPSIGSAARHKFIFNYGNNSIINQVDYRSPWGVSQCEFFRFWRCIIYLSNYFIVMWTSSTNRGLLAWRRFRVAGCTFSLHICIRVKKEKFRGNWLNNRML